MNLKGYDIQAHAFTHWGTTVPSEIKLDRQSEAAPDNARVRLAKLLKLGD